MRIRLLLAAATLTLAACSTSPTGPDPMGAGSRRSVVDETCRSGYHLATREDGTTVCVADA